MNERAREKCDYARTHARSQWKCLCVFALCGVTQVYMLFLVSVSLCFRSHIVVHFVVPILILYQFIQLFPVAILFICFSLYSHGILGVVFTHTVGYSRPPSAVNDPTVTK